MHNYAWDDPGNRFITDYTITNEKIGHVSYTQEIMAELRFMRNIIYSNIIA
jgi:hypothetical protein